MALTDEQVECLQDFVPRGSERLKSWMETWAVGVCTLPTTATTYDTAIALLIAHLMLVARTDTSGVGRGPVKSESSPDGGVVYELPPATQGLAWRTWLASKAPGALYLQLEASEGTLSVSPVLL